MNESYVEMLAIGGKSNSLGKVNEVIQHLLQDNSQLNELYDCMFNKDAWIRMRAADALEKVCREHPDWLLPYIDRTFNDLATSTQPSIQWHLAQIYNQVNLTSKQRASATDWLKHLLSTKEIDWIVAANAMTTLAQFTKDGYFSKSEMILLLNLQQKHKSSAVIKRASKILTELSAN